MITIIIILIVTIPTLFLMFFLFFPHFPSRQWNLPRISDVNQGTIIEYPYNDVQTQLRLKQKISNKILLLQFHREDDALLWKSILAAHVAFYKDTSQHQEEAAIESTS